jgi:hypothetical protein
MSTRTKAIIADFNLTSAHMIIEAWGFYQPHSSPLLTPFILCLVTWYLPQYRQNIGVESWAYSSGNQLPEDALPDR